MNARFVSAADRARTQYLEIPGERKPNQLRSALKLLNNRNDKDEDR